jgi:hypothetical protein
LAKAPSKMEHLTIQLKLEAIQLKEVGKNEKPDRNRAFVYEPNSVL